MSSSRRRGSRVRRGPVLVLATLLALAACVPPGARPYGSPSPDRPVVELEFRVSDDLRTVAGRERITFVPDLDVCELVFRLWVNKPTTAEAGNSMTVTRVAVDGTGVEPVADRAGAPPDAPGTLLEVPLPSCVPAGTAVTADLTFELTLGPGTDERVGTSSSGDLAWFGTAYPLLAWVSGRGWARDAAVDVTGEMAVSEQFQLASLTVVAPSRYAVLGVGEKVGEDVGAESGLTTHRFAASAVRDVTVTVGRLQTIDVDVNGTRVHLGVSPGARAPVSVWQRTVVRRLERVSEYLGPVPVDDLWVSVIPDQTEGIEFPGALQLGDLSLPEDAWVVTHELAHLWFYGLVGNNQARDPWLDEAFASFVEDLIENADSGPTPQDVPDRVADRVGRPMAYWAELRRPSTAYIDGVYVAGAVALMEARRRAGPAAFDDALRDYLSENAHTIARPEDVEEAFAHLPEALEVLRDAGALDRAAAG